MKCCHINITLSFRILLRTFQMWIIIIYFFSQNTQFIYSNSYLKVQWSVQLKNVLYI